MKIFDTNFPSNIFSQYFTDEFVGSEHLTDNEKVITPKFSIKRLKEFSTGRFCARQALMELGYAPTDILKGTDNEPLWPDGITGSISHSGQFTGAIVGSTSNFTAIGIDIETIGKITSDMWDILYTPAEQQFLNAFASKQLAFYTTLIFSFKESFYKMQFPLTKTFLEFTDVEVNLHKNIFEVKIIKEFAPSVLLPTSFLLYHQQKNQVITLCYSVNNKEVTNI